MDRHDLRIMHSSYALCARNTYNTYKANNKAPIKHSNASASRKTSGQGHTELAGIHFALATGDRMNRSVWRRIEPHSDFLQYLGMYFCV
jgi:hypothetical protein